VNNGGIDCGNSYAPARGLLAPDDDDDDDDDNEME